MTKQDQNAGEGAVAIQSGRDTNVGMTSEQMSQILEALAAQLPAYAATARELVDERIAALEERLLAKFADKNAADPEAFKDPDFQYLLTRAQHAHARRGDSGVADIIVDLIAERSKKTSGNRLSMTLNSAIETCASLTPNEFAELSLVFLLRYTINWGIKDFRTFPLYFVTNIMPLLSNISKENSSYQYLEAKQCASISIGSANLHKLLTTSYGGAFSNGFTQEELHGVLPDDQKDIFEGTDLIIPCAHDPAKLQFNAYNYEKLQEAVGQLPIAESNRNAPGGLFTSKLWSEQEIKDRLGPITPGFELLWEIWHETPLQNLSLTSLGIAIGHSNIRLINGFNADLSIWIK